MSDYFRSIPDLMKKFDVSEKVGFLLDEPLDTLPALFRPWENLAKGLEDHLKRKEVRKLVKEEMPSLDNYYSELSTESDTKHKQLCLSYVILTFIGSAYIWQEGESDIAKVIPEKLAVPWHEISQRLGFKPVPCLASVAINNYRLKDKTKPISLENLEVICTVPGARWFFLVTIQVEVDAVKGIMAILNAKKAVLDGSDESLKLALQEMVESIDQIKRTSSRMSEHLDGETFYNIVRPFLGGYGKDSKIPEGLVFEGVSKTAVEAIGGSAAQSSTIQSFDAALGIEHDAKRQEYLVKVREYMPPKHRNFIEFLWKEPSIKTYVTESQNKELKESYRNAVHALCEFRELHYGLVQSFILKPANKVEEAQGTGGITGGASGVLKPADKVEEVHGTGGITDLEAFLSAIQTTTEKAKDKIYHLKSEE